MRNIFVFIAILMFPAICFAGIETLLVEETQGDCTIHVIHDATPSAKTGVIMFRSFVVIDGLHHPCEPTKSQVRETLSKGIAKYISDENLKPITSIMVGKIASFPWVKADWYAKSLAKIYEQRSRDEFNALVSSTAIAQPFIDALESNGLEFDGARCEKIQFYANGHPMNALCWLRIKQHKAMLRP